MVPVVIVMVTGTLTLAPDESVMVTEQLAHAAAPAVSRKAAALVCCTEMSEELATAENVPEKLERLGVRIWVWPDTSKFTAAGCTFNGPGGGPPPVGLGLGDGDAVGVGDGMGDGVAELVP